jgi:hypothetical protein
MTILWLSWICGYGYTSLTSCNVLFNVVAQGEFCVDYEVSLHNDAIKLTETDEVSVRRTLKNW